MPSGRNRHSFRTQAHARRVIPKSRLRFQNTSIVLGQREREPSFSRKARTQPTLSLASPFRSRLSRQPGAKRHGH
jgi:hypothetical protein